MLRICVCTFKASILVHGEDRWREGLFGVGDVWAESIPAPVEDDGSGMLGMDDTMVRFCGS